MAAVVPTAMSTSISVLPCRTTFAAARRMRRPLQQKTGVATQKRTRKRTSGIPVEAGGAVDLHGEEDGPAEREGEQGVDEEAAALVIAAVVRSDGGGDGGGRRLRLGARRDDAVAGGGDRVGQGAGGDVGGGQVDAGALGGEVDGGGLDAGDGGQRPLDAADAGRAVHPLDVQIEAGAVVAPGRGGRGRRGRRGGHGEGRRVGHGNPPMPA